jgi:membrane protease YdiL (CAAX protease family)
MNTYIRRIAAVVEVALVFLLAPYLTKSIYLLFPQFEAWQTQTLGFPVAPFVYVVEAGLSILIILLHRRKLADYGLYFGQLKYQLDIAANCFFPVAVSWLPLAFGLDETAWSGAIPLAAIQVGLLVVLALILRKKALQPVAPATVAFIFLLPSAANVGQPLAQKAIVTFLFYALFVAFGEEILFRGYMQSRLNEAFGKPYRFFGVAFGWGAIIASVLFGLMHVGIFRWILGVNTLVTIAWGFWTFFAGLVSGYVREKSGGILAPAVLHGLPQAIAFTTMMFIPMSALG